MRKWMLLLTTLFGWMASGQITGKVLDAETGAAIPYANIQIDQNENLVTNEEGFFTISNVGDDAILTVSYLGYKPMQLSVGQLKDSQSTVKLQPSVFELDEVRVAGLPSPEAIMAEVRKNLKQNYGIRGLVTDNKIFIRESTSFTGKQVDVEITKSTGFSKEALKLANQDLASFTKRLVSYPPKEYTDILCDYFKETSKPNVPYKLKIIKATKLMDETRSASLDGLQKNAMNLLLKHLDTLKYYRIRSGWFGSNDSISLRKGFSPGKGKTLETNESSAKMKLAVFSSENSLLSGTFDFIHQPDMYTYKYEGSVYLDNGDFAYVITFEPDAGKALYTGKMYISQSDFAVLRTDYTLAKGKNISSMNMKFLLGVKSAENLRKGTIIYKQNRDGDGYFLQYASREDGQYFYINRPLKFIELAKQEEKDVVAFDLKIEGDTFNKTEYLNLSRSEISEAEFDQVAESDFKYLRVSKYDPKIWKGYGAIEPLEEMKQYKVPEQP